MPEVDDLIRELQMYRKTDEIVRVARIAIKEAQDESRRLGVANVYFIDGRTYYELPNGDYTQTPPPGYEGCGA